MAAPDDGSPQVLPTSLGVFLAGCSSQNIPAIARDGSQSPLPEDFSNQIICVRTSRTRARLGLLLAAGESQPRGTATPGKVERKMKTKGADQPRGASAGNKHDVAAALVQHGSFRGYCRARRDCARTLTEVLSDSFHLRPSPETDFAEGSHSCCQARFQLFSSKVALNSTPVHSRIILSP